MSSDPEAVEDEDMRRVREAAEALGEFFDNVQVFVSRVEPKGGLDGTVNVHYGVGNWFARYGQAKEWLIRMDEHTRRGQRNPE